MCVRAVHIVCVVYVNMWHALYIYMYIQHILNTKINAIRGNVQCACTYCCLDIHVCYQLCVSILSCPSSTPESEVEWNRGCVVASAQNFARELKETPSNLLTPSLFVEAVSSKLHEVAGENLEFIPR